MSAEGNEIIINKETKYYWKHRDEIRVKRQAKRMEDPDYVAKYEERMKRKAEKEVLKKEKEEKSKIKKEEKIHKKKQEQEEKKKRKDEKITRMLAKVLEPKSSGEI